MKAFTQIAKPHEDILEGRLTMDVFAADLWQVVAGKAPVDYQDGDLFFRKTYPTKGLQNILDVARKRLQGKSGDSVIQLQTPFGGGKTHTLIALYHKAEEWNAKVVVFDGTALNPNETKPWEELERQLTGKVKATKGDVAPGKEKLIEIISANSPALILMDEILEYATRAAAVKVGDSNLAAQMLPFMQELTGAVSAVGNALLVISLPSSLLEHYDEYGERLFQQIQKISGRMEKIYTPVEEDEIAGVIRKRLFQKVNERQVKEVVDEFVEYARNEGLLSGDEVAEYRDRFQKSYPFKPDVIDVLYKRWGSFPDFQRTRGVLRLLSLLVHDLLDEKIPFIRLGDFNLGNDEIRRELIKHVGQEWDSILAQDITSRDSGAKKVDASVGDSYRPYKLGTTVSTTIFMLSHSGRGERESSIKEIKLSVLDTSFSSTVIDTVISHLRETLFYLSDEELYFTNQPNLNRILLTREENVPPGALVEEEKSMIQEHISKGKLSVYIWPRHHKDVPDTTDLKLVILNEPEPQMEFLEKHGETPRVYRNTLFFLCIDENQKEPFYGFVRRSLALRSIEMDKKLSLTEAQRKEIKNKVKTHEQRAYEEVRKYYRKLFVPAKGGFKEIDLGVPTFGEAHIDTEVYNRLKSEGELLEKIADVTIEKKYLEGRGYVETKNLLEALWKTPGELRIISAEAFKEGIREGVEKGLFGLGYLEDDKPTCKYYKERASVELAEGEVIIDKRLCEKEEPVGVGGSGTEKGEGPGRPGTSTERGTGTAVEEYSGLHLKLTVPIGQVSNIVRMVNFLKTKFARCDVAVNVEIEATDGKLSRSEYEDRIKETLHQSNIHLIDEELK